MISSKTTIASNRQRLQHVIALSGINNVGKTSSLIDVCIDLLCDGKSQLQITDIKNTFNSWHTNNGNPRDIRLIVEYRNSYIYIATGGDDAGIVDKNIDFFDGKAFRSHIYIYDNNSNCLKLVNDVNYSKTYPPHICISACRTGAATMDLLDNYARNVNTMFKKCIFFRKKKDIADTVVQELETVIDRLL